MDHQDLLISAEQLDAGLDNPDLRVVDCRFELLQPAAGRNTYIRGHIPGAVYADLDHDLSAPVGAGTGRHPLPDVAALTQTFGRLGIGRHTRVVVYDDSSGAVAARAWWLLRWLGHENVRLLEGGSARWEELRLPLEEGETTAAPQSFAAAPRDEMVLRTAEIIAAGAEGRALRLVDARDAERFRGDVEPIDVVAGHIPGAINMPFARTQNSDGSWKTRDELRLLWTDTLGYDVDAPWNVMCGSGVTACHLAISGLLAGVREPRLYVGSWSEWITDSGRPIATGGS